MDFGSPLLGGVLIGLGVGGYFYGHGLVMGCSGMVNSVVTGEVSNWPRTLSFFGALLTTGVIFNMFFFEDTFKTSFVDMPWYIYLMAGWLIGFGTKLSNGCTSGHGLMGCSRFSVRSFVATGLFVLSAFLVVNLRNSTLTFSNLKELNFSSAEKKSSETVISLVSTGLALWATGQAVMFPKVLSVLTKYLTNKSVEIVSTVCLSATFAIGLGLGGMLVQENIFNAFQLPTISLTLWILFCTALLLCIIFVQVLPGASSSYSAIRNDITPSLIVGSIAFGAGWGLGGFCPGPLIIQLPRLILQPTKETYLTLGVLTASMIVGVWSCSLVSKVVEVVSGHFGKKTKLDSEHEPLI